MHIVGGDKARAELAPQLEQRLVDLLQLGDVVLLQLDEEVVAPKDLVVPVQLGRAASTLSCLIRRGISADMQPVVAISPSACAARKSWSMRG